MINSHTVNSDTWWFSRCLNQKQTLDHTNDPYCQIRGITGDLQKVHSCSDQEKSFQNLSTCNVTFYLKSNVLPISQIVHSPLQMSPQFWTWFGHSRTLNHYGIDL
ncbi:hypothetical protein GOODEAATRI_028794 [Goodea atripinnis]|uniref:Uncharacterized protein n=1 Tax=Goodea atripinnis TaxID=208336 RepID=A0ABV0PSI4_9TELE